MSLPLNDFRHEFEKVCQQCGRDPHSITLVAVSKKQPLSKIHEAYREKQYDFGENYIQEALEKQNALQLPGIRWHMIGPVQTNKINKILGKFVLIHSVDSFHIAEEINKRAERDGLKVPVLLQLNLAHEETKSGQTKEKLLSQWDQYKKLSALQIEGLMTMPPLQEDPEKSRPYFQELRKLAKQLGLQQLSMGTSSDWKVALEEGATLIRVGTSVFGERST